MRRYRFMAGAIPLCVLLVGTVGLVITNWRRPTTAARAAAKQTPVDSACAGGAGQRLGRRTNRRYLPSSSATEPR